MEKLRKVSFTLPGGKPIEGYFHGFFQVQNGYEANSIALIEGLSGQVYEVNPECVIFLVSPEAGG